MTIISFCQWVINDLHEIPNEALEPGFPRQTSVTTAKKAPYARALSFVSEKDSLYWWS